MVRKLDNCIDFTFIEGLVKDLYSDFGRSGIPSVVFFKLIFINIIFGINSMRKTCEECKTNANKNKHKDVEVEIVKKVYEDELLEEINEDRIKHGKKKLIV